MNDNLLTDAELIAEKLAEANKLIASELAEKLLASNEVTAKNLCIHNDIVTTTASKRFDKQKFWYWTLITVSSLTLIILLLFTIAFFKFAIIVKM